MVFSVLYSSNGGAVLAPHHPEPLQSYLISGNNNNKHNDLLMTIRNLTRSPAAH